MPRQPESSETTRQVHALLTELRDHTYVMLRPSPIAGVGVFAIRDIPKGCRAMFSAPGRDSDWLTVPRAEIDALPTHARQVVENYCLFDEASYFVPARGFKELDVSLFLNHSDVPNVVSIEDGAYFEAVRDIAVGEELLVDYGEIVDGDD